MMISLSPNEQAALERKQFHEARVKRLVQVREQAKDASIAKTAKYEVNLAQEWTAKLAELKHAYEEARLALISDIHKDFENVDLGRAQRDALDQQQIHESNQQSLIPLEITRQAAQDNLATIAARALHKSPPRRDTSHLQVERERARLVAAKHRKAMADPVYIEPTRTARPIGLRSGVDDFASTAHHRSVAVLRSTALPPRTTADKAAAEASQRSADRLSARMRDAVMGRAAADARHHTALAEVSRQKNKTRLLQTLGDIRMLDARRKQANGLAQKTAHSLYGKSRDAVAADAFSKRFIAPGVHRTTTTLVASAGERQARRRPTTWVEDDSLGSVELIKFA